MQNTNLDTMEAKALESAAKTKSSNWLTHTRRWNLIFASIMSFGIGSSFALDTLKLGQPYGLISSLLFWITLFLGPMLLKMFDDVKYLKGKTFIALDDRKINAAKGAPEFKVVCFVSIGLVLLVGFFSRASSTLVGQALTSFVMISSMILLFASFFIYKNCPISIILHLKYWQSQPKSSYVGINTPTDIFAQSRDDSSRRMNPSHGYMSNNAYHSSYYRNR